MSKQARKRKSTYSACAEADVAADVATPDPSSKEEPPAKHKTIEQNNNNSELQQKCHDAVIFTEFISMMQSLVYVEVGTFATTVNSIEKFVHSNIKSVLLCLHRKLPPFVNAFGYNLHGERIEVDSIITQWFVIIIAVKLNRLPSFDFPLHERKYKQLMSVCINTFLEYIKTYPSPELYQGDVNILFNVLCRTSNQEWISPKTHPLVAAWEWCASSPSFDINKKFPVNGYTELHMAARRVYEDKRQESIDILMKWLISHGADIHMEDSRGNNFLSLIVSHEMADMAQWLLKEKHLVYADLTGQTPKGLSGANTALDFAQLTVSSNSENPELKSLSVLVAFQEATRIRKEAIRPQIAQLLLDHTPMAKVCIGIVMEFVH